MIDITDIQTFPSDLKLNKIAGENLQLKKENKIVGWVCGILLVTTIIVAIEYKKQKNKNDGKNEKLA